MKKKNSSRDNLNLFFSAFLVIAYIVCAYFFISFSNRLSGVLQPLVTALVFVVFGLLLFYATRVGDGITVKRFSIITLILLDLPALYVILASMFTVLPLNSILTSNSMLVYMAAVALGYGIPYTFISGFEIVEEEVEEETPELVEGGVEEEMMETEEAQEAQEDAEEAEDEIVVEGVAATEEAEEAVEEETAEATEE